MKSFNRALAMLLILVLSLSTLAACNIGGDTNDGEENLQTDTYVANIKMSFSTTDEKMKDAVDAMQDLTAKLSVDKKKFKLESTTLSGDITIRQSYIFVASQLYHSIRITAEDGETTNLSKAVISNTDRADLVSSLGAGANIGLSDFKTHDVNKNGKETTYTCSSMFDESKESLSSIMSERFAGIGATVSVESASYTLKRISGRDSESTFVCNYLISLNGESYRVTLTTTYTYDYTADVNISAPANADEYTDVPYTEIIG